MRHVKHPNFGVGELPIGADGFIPERPCRRCGDPTLSILEVDNTVQILYWIYLCQPCKALHMRETAELRATYDAMLARGVSKETANEIMTRWFVRPTEPGE